MGNKYNALYTLISTRYVYHLQHIDHGWYYCLYS